jgi:hypothetical protein
VIAVGISCVVYNFVCCVNLLKENRGHALNQKVRHRLDQRNLLQELLPFLLLELALVVKHLNEILLGQLEYNWIGRADETVRSYVVHRQTLLAERAFIFVRNRIFSIRVNRFQIHSNLSKLKELGTADHVSFDNHHHLAANTLFPNHYVARFVNLDRYSFDKTDHRILVTVLENCRMIQFHVKHQKVNFCLVSTFWRFLSQGFDWD